MSTNDTPPTTAWPSTPTPAGLDRIRAARAEGVRWLTDRVGDDGRPEGAEVANVWWRAPWALCVGGAPDVAAAMMGWVEREALTDDGDLRPGPHGGDAPGSPVYHLSPLAIAAWLLARYDTARTVTDRLASFQDPESGGAYDLRDFDADPLQDTLKTGQLGISALVTGEADMARGVYRWLARNHAAQPALPGRLHPSWRGDGLVLDATPDEAFLRLVDYSAPRQAYFHSGIAGAFLAGYAQQTGDGAALRLGQDYLELNRAGTDAQFDDVESVQICKFGWGVAAMHVAAPDSGQLPSVVKMGEWFVRRQRPDGAWAPSSFLTPDPGVLDLYWKTAEHVMELAYIEQALA
ncbi:hypothetical protein, partial [Modestobacter roseus]